ncbi:MAG: GNAT family N-acetyltransferase [Deltaproteobacteria bacterium]|nr:GNAT family N-acetyltransferase [Deltaproteobacteria bacterium]
MPLRIEHLTREHNRQGFDCGSVELNKYLHSTARQHSEKGISRTFVLIEDEKPSEILGFFTLVSCEILVEKLPKKYSKKYPDQAPAAKLARLAVSKRNQKKGLGARMMINAMERVLRVSEHLGVIGFFVDAKDDKAASYYRQFGFMPLPDNSLELFLPLATIRQAFMAR